jgi:hypothetical protein
MGMLWMMHLSLAALQETPDIDQTKNNLQDDLRAGNCANNLRRLILDAWKPKPAATPIFGLRQDPGSSGSQSITLPGKMASISGKSSTPLALG